MRHVTCQRAGSTVDEPTCALFVAIERVTCSTPSCGGLRPRESAIAVVRPAWHSPPLSATFSAPSAPDLLVGLPPVNLPDFTQRMRSLPANTMLRVPSGCRFLMIVAVAQCWQGVPRGSDEYSQLEDGRWKLLLLVPEGLGAAAVVAKRLALWEERRSEDLLRQEHLLLNHRPGQKTQRRSLDSAPARADRAPRMAAVGACRWACLSMLSFEESDDLSWAEEILPTSSLDTQAHSDPLLELSLAPPEADWDRPFAGRHAALTARALWHSRRADHGFAERTSSCARQQNPRCSGRSFLHNLSRLVPAAALLAAEEEWQTATHQDGRALAVSPRQAACEPAPGRPPLRATGEGTI